MWFSPPHYTIIAESKTFHKRREALITGVARAATSVQATEPEAIGQTLVLARTTSMSGPEKRPLLPLQSCLRHEQPIIVSNLFDITQRGAAWAERLHQAIKATMLLGIRGKHEQ